jgi:hypothetical protein
MNLINPNSLPKYHRELLEKEFVILKPKTFYSEQNLWEYYFTCVYGRSTNYASAYLTNEELEKIKSAFIASIRPPTTIEINILQTLYEKYGLEEVLFAIDEFSDNGETDINNLPIYIEEAKRYIKTLENIIII